MVVVGEDTEIVLNCYRMARFYRCDPRVFLDMPLSEVDQHLRYTCRLNELMRAESESD